MITWKQMKINSEEELAYWNKWLLRITPCTIGVAISLLVVVYCMLALNKSGGFSLMGLILLPFALGLFIAHKVVRNFLPNKAAIVWALEFVIVIVTTVVFKSLVWGA